MYLRMFPNKTTPTNAPNPIGNNNFKLNFIFLKKFKAQLSKDS